MKLTKQHIENLYQFTRQHYVIHYDLQTELVDHMANAIEEIWENYPDLSFETARDQSFKTFGVFGFMEVAGKRQKAMNKRYMKMLWSFAKTWFTFPKLIQTLALFAIVYTGFELSFGKYISIATFSVLFTTIFFKSFKYIKYIKRKEKPGQRLWLLEDLIFRNASANAFLQLSLIVNMYQTIESSWNYKYSPLVAAIVFMVLAIYSYVSVVVLPKQSEKLLKKTYPEYGM